MSTARAYVVVGVKIPLAKKQRLVSPASCAHPDALNGYGFCRRCGVKCVAPRYVTTAGFERAHHYFELDAFDVGGDHVLVGRGVVVEAEHGGDVKLTCCDLPTLSATDLARLAALTVEPPRLWLGVARDFEDY